MERRHTLLKINFSVSLEVGVNIDFFKRCVAAVRKWLSAKLTAIKSGTVNSVRRIFSAASLRWTVDKLKEPTAIVAIVLVFHLVTTAMSNYLGLGLPTEFQLNPLNLLVELLCCYLLQKAGILK